MATYVSPVKWYGARITREIRAEMLKRLDQSGRELVTEIERNISSPGPAPSSPGEFPHRQTGGLAGAIGYEIDADKLVLRVAVAGDKERQALALEFGTENAAPRPFLKRSFFEFRSRLLAILTAAGGGRGLFR